MSRCLTCRKTRASPRPPVMADLPSGRLAYKQRPSSHCGLDYFGPMWVKIGRGREKLWGVLFTCLTVRAVHLELAHSLTASSAIIAIQRMAARRGTPSVIYADNGTNFRGTCSELKDEKQLIDHESIGNYALSRKIRWEFNPSRCPSHGRRLGKADTIRENIAKFCVKRASSQRGGSSHHAFGDRTLHQFKANNPSFS